MYAFAERWRQEQDQAAKGSGYVPMHFDMGEAFQFDWSTEYAVIGGLRRRLEVAHTKLAASRAFVLSAYYSQAHEMLFDSHARAFGVFGGITRRRIYDNMKTAVDKVGEGKTRTVNASFEAMTGQYLFDAEFRNQAAGWEKGIAEKNVQDGDIGWIALPILGTNVKLALLGHWKSTSLGWFTQLFSTWRYEVHRRLFVAKLTLK